MLSKVLYRYIAKESSACQISARGKYRFYICIGHIVQPICKLNSTPQLTYPPNRQTNIVSLQLLRQEEHNFVLSNKCFTVAKVVYACPSTIRAKLPPADKQNPCANLQSFTIH